MKALSLLIFLLALLPLPAGAQTPPTCGDQPLAACDLDHDNVISILDAATLIQHIGEHTTWTPIPTSTSTPTAIPTSTPTDTATGTATASETSVATTTSTATPSPSETPSPVPTVTETPTWATSTPLAPSSTFTRTPSPSSTASRTASPTSSPSNTPTPSPVPTVTPTATSTNLTELLIAERGAAHEILLPAVAPDSGPRSYSWGMHGQEAAKSGTGSLDAWLVVERDASQLGTAFTTRVAIKTIRMMVLVGGTWRVGMAGSPGLGWMVTSNPQTNGNYHDVGHNVESDGSWSFAFPPNVALHFAENSPGYVIPGTATGVAVIIEARVIGGSGTKWGLNAGADYKTASGQCAAICGAAGLGRFGLLTGAYRWYTMLSTQLSDAQVRQNPPF